MYDNCNTPCYIYDEDVFAEDIRRVKSTLGDIPLTYSIKANPVMTGYVPDEIRYVEVCSPGELKVCKAYAVSPDRILYSGVVKGEEDVTEALEYGVRLFTAESPSQFELVRGIATKKDITADMLLRLSNGNQFGMSADDIKKIISDRADYTNVNIIGLHFYGGTQKKDVSQIREELETICTLTSILKVDLGFETKLVEYGPGLFVDYFSDMTAEDVLAEFAPVLDCFRDRLPLGIEMGRFLAAECGEFVTSIKDIKKTGDITYAMIDGGINHLNYFGQKIGMKLPKMAVIQRADDSDGEADYSICGSLCTTADIIVRKAHLPRLSIGDRLVFKKCGAYSGCEAMGLFLSRQLPSIYLRKDGELRRVRDALNTYSINIGKE